MSASPSASSSASVSGTANVAYASSLEFLNENVVKPAFTAATGLGYSGTGNASGTLESDIAAGEISPNVFESVGGDNITPLQPKFTKWYIPYAGTSMVIAYNPKSKYASEFKAYADGSKPLSTLFSTLLQTPGLKLGRFRLVKHLPAAAGLGGGSADAAAALRLLAEEGTAIL